MYIIRINIVYVYESYRNPYQIVLNERICSMYRMIIIDDEPIVREGLMRLLSWKDYQFEVCAQGIDGIDGLEKVLKYQPDLVLVDVKMPGMSGLELIQKAKEKGFKGQFIILTGFSDFDFAKTAISLGVRDYLLKPVDEDELSENICAMVKEWEEISKLRKINEFNEQTAIQELIRSILLFHKDKEQLLYQMKMYHYNFEYSKYCVAILCNQVGSVKIGLEYPSKEKLDVMIKGIENIDYINIEDKWVLIGKGISYQNILHTLLENNKKLHNIFNDKYFICMGHDVVHWEDIHYSYECAKLLSEYQFIFHNEEAVTIDALKECKEIVIDNLFELISFQIEVGDLEELKRSFIKIEEYCKLKLLKESDVKILLSHHLFMTRNTLEERYEKRKGEFPEYNVVSNWIKGAPTLKDLLTYATDYCVKLSQIIAASGTENVIRRVHVYVEKNYQKDLKLESIAKVFNYNSAYLGKLFKKEMGENFNNFLDHIRIENAKRMLTESDLKVYQVSERVGYSNIDYFYSKFKRYVGISPKEFKKTVSKESV